MDAHQKAPDTYILLARKISRRANLQRDTDLLCQAINGCGNNTASDVHLNLCRRKLAVFFDDDIDF